MNSLQNLAILQNLYVQRACGQTYSDTIVINQEESFTLANSIDELDKLIKNCHLCDLSKSRQQSMSHFGNQNADVMIVDAYVSMAEDQADRYFMGRSGESLQKMIENVLQLDINSIFLTHGVKCKALGANTPSMSEYNSCKAYLFKQIELVKPKIIIALGSDAYSMLTTEEENFDTLVGHHIPFSKSTLVPIYHPAYLLKNPSLKTKTLSDLQSIKALL